MEALEDRRLLAVGPQLVGIQPNTGELLFDGQVRNTAPRELSLLFNSAAEISESSLPTSVSQLSPYDSIQITRSGLDGTFERASVFSDFNTLGAVQIEFEAVAAGQAGGVIAIHVSKAQLGTTRFPTVQVQDNRINLTLNTRLGFETRASDLVTAVNAHVDASRLVTAKVRRGLASTNIAAPAINYSPLVMAAANTAKATSSFNAGTALAIQFTATQPGMGGNGIMIQVSRANLGADALPQVSADGRTVSVVLNSNALTPTTASQLVTVINSHPQARALVNASIRSGDPATLIGNRTINYSPLVLTGANDVRVELGYLGLGDSSREVIVRFQDHLPDDLYMIEILGSGPTPLTNTAGDAFNEGANFQMAFELNLGPQVVAVVPQPVVRNAAGQLSQRRNVIEVYFNDDDLDPVSAQNPLFYQLIHTRETVHNTDDVVVYPTAVQYNAARDMAVLTFSQPLEELVAPGTYRLRIGTQEDRPAPPVGVPVVEDPGSSFSAAMDLSSFDLEANGLLLSSSIVSPLFPLDFPGGNDEPGHRDIPWIETHLSDGGDSFPGIRTIYYNFKDEYGFDPNGQILRNAITETQKQRAREVFDFYARYLGVNFIESANGGWTIVTGDLRAVNPYAGSGVGGVAGIACTSCGMAIMDLQDFDNPGDDAFGGPWFRTAMGVIGHLLRLGRTNDLPPYAVSGSESDLSFGQAAELVFPGDHDIVHGQFLHRPESNDIDMYEFTLTGAGLLSAETIASRQANPSLLDTVLTLYRANVDDTGRVIDRELIARSDDYYGKDSFIGLYLQSGTYYVGVSAAGNADYDPAIEDSGSGGRSQGDYQLRLNFRPDVNNAIADATGVALDGNGDGNPGGVHNFWFRAATPAGVAGAGEPRTLFVDKAAAAGGNGSLTQPFNRIPAALAAARPNDIVRLVGNPGADGDITTLEDNLAYQIGFSRVGGAVLEDGATLEVPQGVTVMIDANAVLKLRRARIGVGSSAQGVDRSAGSLQVLGAPRLFDTTGNVIRDATGQPVAGSVYFTSMHDRTIGKDNNPDQNPPAARPGDWSGIVFRNDLDIADANRLVFERQGIFLDYVNHAEFLYGGGSVFINGVPQSIAPIHMIDARPTITFNTITKSSGAGMSANPNSFEEDNFHAPKYQGIPFTSDYTRVGPEIHHNTLVQNSLNGLFIHVSTAAGQGIETLTKSARWDDTDIVHIVSENLIIQGQAGGPIAEDVAPPVNVVTLQAVAGGTLEPGSYEYRIVFVDAAGNEGPPSDATRSVEVTGVTGSVLLGNLPRVGQDEPFVARRIYRALVGTDRFERVAQINAEDTVFLDTGTSLGIMLQEYTDSIRARLAGRLAVDPGTIVKLDRSRIDASFGAQLIAEGRDGEPVVFTSLHDVRYGFGGTFDTSFQQGGTPARPGDWSGLYLGHLSKGSLDFAVVAHAGGTSRIEGTFAGFNPVEIQQSEVRIANTKFERSANGLGGQAPADRFGRGTHDGSTLFLRGAQPVIVSNTFVGNAGSAISVNVNAINHLLQGDTGRSTGPIGIVSETFDNRGPLIRLNRLADNEINGMTVRGGTLTTQGVWDDTDIVHVVRDEVIVPDFHTYGGLRLQSSPQESLVVKLSGPRAGFTATGRELDITDRIGGSLQVVGQPRFPVVFTALSDDSTGAGFTPDGLPQNDTNGDGTTEGRLPTGPEVNRDTLIDNDVPVEIPGFFSFDVFDGGESTFNGRGGITAQGNNELLINENVVYDFLNYIDVGRDGNAINLRNTSITTPATLIDHDLVISEGTIQGQNGLINWRVESRLENGIAIVYNTLTLSSAQPLGNMRFINYLDEDIRGVSDDILHLTGTPGTNDFRAFTLDGPERVGFSHGGFLEPGPNLVNATFDGWAADEFPQLRSAIAGPGTTYSIAGNIDTTDLTPFDDPQLGLVYGPSDVTTAFAWSVNPTATQARITSLLELIPRNPATTGQPGDWRSLRLAEFSNDRNVDVVTEREPRDSITGPGSNGDLDRAQSVGRLAPHEKAGDDALRLGFEIQGVISEPGDVDVYSFQGTAGTEVWFDIDRTSPSLDTVVELIDAQGNIIAQSDDSYAEELGLLALYADPTKIDPRLVNPLRKSATDFYPESALGLPKDLWSTNPRDAGMRVVLPGSQGTVNTYYVRVRSSNIKPGEARDALQDPARVNDGLTTGVYQLQIRLRETDEVPGSTVQFADIRYAQNGIEILGQPTHSPLTGEAAEGTASNDTFATAQPLGNLLNTDRGTLAVAGSLSGPGDVDFYRFEVTFDSLCTTEFTNHVRHLAAIFDIDYADGLARPGTRISVFDANGNLVLHGDASNIADDQPGPLKGTNMDDLSRGSAGSLDPYIGTQELPAGTYYVAISLDGSVPLDFEQFYSPNPTNPLFRLEPINSVERIVEDRIDSEFVTTVSPPQIPVLFDESRAVPYHLGDVVLFISYPFGDGARLATVDPFSGTQETAVGDVGVNIADVAMRPDGTLWTFSLGQTDDDSGNYIRISTGDGTITNVGDDGIETWQLNEAGDADEEHDVGYQFRAMTYGDPLVYGANYLFAVGDRVEGLGVEFNQNVLYQFNAETGVAISDPAINREGFDTPGGPRSNGAGTQIVERGALNTSAGGAPGGTITGIAFVGPTMYAVTDTGGLFRVNEPGEPESASARYITTSAQDLRGINFQSLSAGPVETEDGQYAELLFATSATGQIYAFNTAGRLQPVFVNGQTSINTGLSGVHGMAFSILEENPWKIVDGELGRALDPGHGVDLTFDLSRVEPDFRIDGLASLHFGPAPDTATNTVGTYDWPGGAHGTLESHAFSLAGYSAADKPVLYFNYWAKTQQESSDPATKTPMLDSLRVFINNRTGGWDQLATNNSYKPHELTPPPPPAAQNVTQELFDNDTGWRQVRIELDNYAGRDDLQIRIDFATAGEMNVGDPTTVGSELRIVPGSQLSDGQTFVVGGVRFEIEMGYTLVVPSGSAIRDGNTFRVTRGPAENRVFEFDAGGSVSDPSHIPIGFFTTMNPEELTVAIAQAIRGEFADFRVNVVGNRINLPDADLVSIAPGNALGLTGSPGTTGLPVVVDSSMSATQVATVVRQALADRFAGGVIAAFKTYDNVVRVIGRNVNDQGPFGLTSQLPGDNYGDFFRNLRGQNNAFEGIYLDDFIIGFAERGEMGTNAAGLTTFYANPQALPNQIVSGPYQLEIRQAEKYGVSLHDPDVQAPDLQAPDWLVLKRSFDTNARLSESHSLFAPPANEISDGQTFTLSDGSNSLTFEFDDVSINNGVTPGNVRVPFNSMMLDLTTGDRRPQTASEVAAAIRDAINSQPAQSVLKITAALADGAVRSSTASTSSVVNLFGTVDAELIDPVLRVTGTTTDGNQLRDALLLGGALEPVGDATFVGGSNSAGFFVGGASSIGIASGIVLTTGDARFVEGPNTDDRSSALASGMGDPDLDDFFAPFVTLDATVLEFSFRLPEPGDLFFEFVFASEEYNEFVNSEYNDVFAFFLNGENVGFLPGTLDPVTINTVNGGKPYGTGGVNAEFFRNNDLGDGGQYLDVFGHDGFTSVFTSGMTGLPAGLHTMKLAIADVGDTILDSAIFIRAFNVIGPDLLTQIPGAVNTDKGDRNLPRDQGQVIIHSNTISESLGYGIVVAPGERSPEGRPHAGPVRVTRMLNADNLVPGVVITNNLIARNNQGGISFSGDENLNNVTAATVPFGRIVNNTIYGGNVGVLVQHNASPTLLSNIVADNATGISIDASSSSTVVGGTLYAGSGVRSSNGNLGDSPVEVLSSDNVFMNKDLGNFYPRPGSPAIDSAFDSLLDRNGMVGVRQPLGIANSPILAPDLDLYGQRRVDDPDVTSPSGLGQNVFKDRGAIDRSDFAGPNAVIVNPQDDDVFGKDRDPRDSFVDVRKETLFDFSIQLIDGVPPANDSYGSGPDPNTVVPQTVMVTRDGVILHEGADYRFSYHATGAVIRLTPLAGIWEPDRIYEIHLLNVDTLMITASPGDLVSDGDSFVIRNSVGQTATFEFESGYSLIVPETGGAAIVDGTTFIITRNTRTTIFEFDRNSQFRSGNVAVPYAATDTADMIAASIAAAIRNAAIGLTPEAYPGGFVHVGGDTGTLLNVNNTALVQQGTPGVTEGRVPVPFVPHESFTAAQMAASIAAAIDAGPLPGVTAQARQHQVVVVGAESILGIANVAVGAIKDRAGNTLQPNRFDGSTAFTVFLGSGFDYGDAPSPYPVLKADNGARHEVVDGFMLGNSVFATVDGQPSPNADADPGDEGVSFAPMYAAYQSQVTVTVLGITPERPGYLDAWIDFNGDGDWNDSFEKVFNRVPLVEGANTLPITVLSTAQAGTTFARFRLSSTGGLAATGTTSDGEVEDYRVTILANPWQNPINPLDVNGDTKVNPFDVLLIINLLNRNPGVTLPVPPTRQPGMPDTDPLPFYDVNGDGKVLPFDAFQIINYLNSPSSRNSLRSISGEGEGEGPSDGWAGGDSLDTLVSQGLDTGVSNSPLLVTATSSSSSPLSWRPFLASDSRRVTSGVAPVAPVYTGLPDPPASATWLRDRVVGSDLREEDLGNLLDQIAGEGDDLVALEEAHDAFFARLDA